MSLIKLKKPFQLQPIRAGQAILALRLLSSYEDQPRDFHHAIGRSVWLDTSSATAKYVASPDFRPSISDVESKKGNARSKSTSVAVGLRSLI